MSEYTKLKVSDVALELDQKTDEDEDDSEKTKVMPAKSSDDSGRPGDNYIDFVVRVKSCVEDGENIDIYQYLAYKWKDVGPASPEIWRLTHEVTMCILAQMIGIIVILNQVIEDGVDDKESCNDSPTELKLLAFALSSVAGYISMEVFMHEKGMYGGGITDICIKGRVPQIIDIYSQPPEWISLFWLGVGTWVNRIVSVGAVAGSFMVIFFSADAFDMVLNSVALFFLMELDNMLMTQPKYNDMCQHLSTWPANKSRDQIIMKYPDGTSPFYKLARKGKADANICCCFLQGMGTCCNFCCFCCYAFFGVFFVIACVVIPVYIGVCY